MTVDAFDRDAALSAMRAKYRELHRLRTMPRTDDDGCARGSEAVASRARLAARFPGALRELDDLPTDEIELRIAALDDAAAGGDVPDWLEPLARYHGWMRALLRAKRWLGRSRVVDDALRDRFAREATRSDDEPAVEVVAALLHEIASPPRGRLSVIAFREIARVVGGEPDDVRRTSLPSKRERRACAP